MRLIVDFNSVPEVRIDGNSHMMFWVQNNETQIRLFPDLGGKFRGECLCTLEILKCFAKWDHEAVFRNSSHVMPNVWDSWFLKKLEQFAGF